MTKSEIIKNIHANTDFNYNEIEILVEEVFSQIINGLKDEDKVVISGFGTFEKYYQEGYQGINPSTGEAIQVAGNYKIRFNASKKVKEVLK